MEGSPDRPREVAVGVINDPGRTVMGRGKLGGDYLPEFDGKIKEVPVNGQQGVSVAR